MSGAPIIIGKNQFPKPPIKTGITIKKIIKKARCNNNIVYLVIPNKLGCCT